MRSDDILNAGFIELVDGLALILYIEQVGPSPANDAEKLLDCWKLVRYNDNLAIVTYKDGINSW